MWKAAAGQQIQLEQSADDDWETDPDFVNDVNEQEQRWGSATVVGSGRTAGAIDMTQLRKETEEADALKKKKELLEGDSNPSFGYGGKFGIEKDRMDQSAVGHDYVPKLEKHASQKDYSAGFGGKYGVQTDRVDKSAVSWEHKEKVVKHASQKDYTSGFGGKFGVQTDRQDKSAMGWDHVEKVEKHESQKDYSKGFGGKYGVQSDRQDKSAVGWDHHEAPQKHESQTDQKLGFGGKFGLQTDRVDKSAASFDDEPSKVGTNYTKTRPDIGGAKPSDLRARFENMGTQEKQQTERVSTPKKNIHAKAAIFNKTNDEPVRSILDTAPKTLDASKTAFLTQSNQIIDSQKSVALVRNIPDTTPKLDASKTAFLTQSNQVDSQSSVPAQLNPTKLAQFNNNDVADNPGRGQKATNDENKTIEHQKIVQNTVPKQVEEIYENVESVHAHTDTSPTDSEDVYYTTDEIVDTGVSAVAMYDYQAAAEDEISFDPDDEITHIEKIDEGWWRGLCKGKYGLFPANYVHVYE